MSNNANDYFEDFKARMFGEGYISFIVKEEGGFTKIEVQQELTRDGLARFLHVIHRLGLTEKITDNRSTVTINILPHGVTFPPGEHRL